MQAVAFKAGAGTVHALVIADNTEDAACAGEIIARGAAMSPALIPFLSSAPSGAYKFDKFDAEKSLGIGPPPRPFSSDMTVAGILFAESLGIKVVPFDK